MTEVDYKKITERHIGLHTFASQNSEGVDVFMSRTVSVAQVLKVGTEPRLILLYFVFIFHILSFYVLYPVFFTDFFLLLIYSLFRPI